MEINQEFASYILGLQIIAECERGVYDADIKYRDLLEDGFPKLKEQRIKNEFREWVWKEKVNKHPDIVKMRRILNKANPQKISMINEYDDLRDKLFKEFTNRKNKKALFKEYVILKSIEKMQK